MIPELLVLVADWMITGDGWEMIREDAVSGGEVLRVFKWTDHQFRVFFSLNSMQVDFEVAVCFLAG